MKDEALKLAKSWFEANTYGDEAVEVYEAIEQALAAPTVQEPLSFNCSAGCGACGVKLQDFVTRQTQAQEGDEWVVVATEPQIVSTCCGSPVEVWDERKQDITASVDATPPAQPAVQEPVAWEDGPHLVVRSDMRERLNYKGPWVDMGRAIPDAWVPVLYTTPPAAQRQWVGLTDEERNECTQSPFTADQHLAIEAKLKEKNT